MAKKQDKEVLPNTAETLNDWGTNYAAQDDVATRFMEHVTDKLELTRNNRRSLEEQWVADLRLWSCILDEGGYVGKSSLFVPELNDQIENTVEKNITALFPTGDIINCVALKNTDKETAEKIRMAVQYELQDKANLLQVYDRHTRNKVLYGTAILKQGFEKKTVDTFTRNAKGKAVKSDMPIYNGVTVRPVDIFRFYVYPEQVAHLDEAQILFEDQMVARSYMEEQGGYVKMDQVGDIAADVDHEWVDIERLQIVRLTNMLTRYRNSVLLTEVWCDFKLTKNGPSVPVRGVIANKNVLVALRRNSFWFQQPPYLGSRYKIRPGDLYYGLSLPDKIRSQQYQMNDLANQTMDSLNYTINPIAIIDPALAGDVNSMKLRPGARWLGSPEGIQFAQFPDVSPSGLRAMQEIRGMVAQFSDATPGVAPQLQGKARSATQAAIVQSSVGARQRMMSNLEETSVLGPLCKRTHIMLQQFMTEEYQISVQGPDNGSWIAMNVKPEDLVGDVNFLWKGQSQAEKTAVYSQQLLAFFQLALQIQQMMPGEVDIPALFKRVAKEGFQLTDLDMIFKSIRDKKTVDPELENIALMEEQDVPINNGDDDRLHIETVDVLLAKKGITDMTRIMAARHKEKHLLQQQAKTELKKQQAQLQAQQQMLQMQQMVHGKDQGKGQGGQPGAPQGAPSPMEGNRGQVPMSDRGMLSAVSALPGGS